MATQIVDLPELRLGEELFIRDWQPGRLPATDGWMHSGCAVTQDGSVVVAHPEGRRLLFLQQEGCARTVAVPVLEMHAIQHDLTDGEETLWLANNGLRLVPGQPDYTHEQERGSVVRVRLDGTFVQELECPDADAYAAGGWQPTSVVRAHDGSVWVADGYGMSLLHQFAPDGVYQRSWDGAASGLRLSCPHGLAVRGTQLLVADRGNRRLLVLDEDGSPQVLDAPLTSPSSILVRGEWIVVTELHGGLALFCHDSYVGHFARSTADPGQEAWPNRRDEAGIIRQPVLGPALRSPHGIAGDAERIIVTEWLVGGRVEQYSKAEGHGDAGADGLGSSDRPSHV